MPSIAGPNGILYRPLGYEKEAELEADVVTLADRIFGSSTIYVDVKKRMRGNEIISIPDGYVIDTTEVDHPKLFVIENEIAKHDPFKHVGIQLLRFATSFEDAQLQVRRFLMEEISKSSVAVYRLDAACQASSERNIDAYLDKAVYGPFQALVLIDEARPELHHVLGKINANISVLEIRRYQSDDGEILHHFDTLYEEAHRYFVWVDTPSGMRSRPPKWK